MPKQSKKHLKYVPEQNIDKCPESPDSGSNVDMCDFQNEVVIIDDFQDNNNIYQTPIESFEKEDYNIVCIGTKKAGKTTLVTSILGNPYDGFEQVRTSGNGTKYPICYTFTDHGPDEFSKVYNSIKILNKSEKQGIEIQNFKIPPNEYIKSLKHDFTYNIYDIPGVNGPSDEGDNVFKKVDTIKNIANGDINFVIAVLEQNNFPEDNTDVNFNTTPADNVLRLFSKLVKENENSYGIIIINKFDTIEYNSTSDSHVLEPNFEQKYGNIKSYIMGDEHIKKIPGKSRFNIMPLSALKMWNITIYASQFDNFLDDKDKIIASNTKTFMKTKLNDKIKLEDLVYQSGHDKIINHISHNINSKLEEIFRKKVLKYYSDCIIQDKFIDKISKFKFAVDKNTYFNKRFKEDDKIVCAKKNVFMDIYNNTISNIELVYNLYEQNDNSVEYNKNFVNMLDDLCHARDYEEYYNEYINNIHNMMKEYHGKFIYNKFIEKKEKDLDTFKFLISEYPNFDMSSIKLNFAKYSYEEITDFLANNVYSNYRDNAIYSSFDNLKAIEQRTVIMILKNNVRDDKTCRMYYMMEKYYENIISIEFQGYDDNTWENSSKFVSFLEKIM